MVSMKTRLTTGLAVLMLALQIGGCATLQNYWPWSKPPPPPPPPAPAVSKLPNEIPPTTVVEEPTKRKRHRTHLKKALAGQPVQTPPAPGSPETSPTTVTLDDNDADRQQAQTLVNDADSQLARIDRTKLSGEDTAAYDQASDLTDAARKAMVQSDYLAASGLARKAALLTAQLPTHPPSR